MQTQMTKENQENQAILNKENIKNVSSYLISNHTPKQEK